MLTRKNYPYLCFDIYALSDSLTACRYLIHSARWAKSDEELQRAWAGMEAVKESGKAKSIGVSSFYPSHLKAISQTARIQPSINQLEFHPYFSKRQQKPFLPALRSPDTGSVAVSAYGALAPLTRNIPGPLDETLKLLADKYRVTPELVCFRWCLDQDVAVVTTTRRVERMKEYLRVFDFKLSPDDIEKISEDGYACVGTQEPKSRNEKYHEMLEAKGKSM